MTSSSFVQQSSSRRRSFFEKEGNRSVFDPDELARVNQGWEAQFGPEDKNLALGVKYPPNWKLNEKKDLLELGAKKKTFLSKFEETMEIYQEKLEEDPKERVVDDSILTLEQKMYLAELQDHVRRLTAENQDILDAIKVYKVMKEQQNENEEQLQELVECLSKRLFMES